MACAPPAFCLLRTAYCRLPTCFPTSASSSHPPFYTKFTSTLHPVAFLGAGSLGVGEVLVTLLLWLLSLALLSSLPLALLGRLSAPVCLALPATPLPPPPARSAWARPAGVTPLDQPDRPPAACLLPLPNPSACLLQADVVPPTS